MTAREFVREAGARIERAACVVRRVIGVPDYERYVAHLQAHHPGATPMTPEEFTQDRLVNRYNKPGTRCC